MVVSGTVTAVGETSRLKQMLVYGKRKYRQQGSAIGVTIARSQ
jgi:hypothetical protein